jgi:hypothetical protein
MVEAGRDDESGSRIEAARESIAGSGGDDEPNLCSRTRPRGSQLYPIEQTYLCIT